MRAASLIIRYSVYCVLSDMLIVPDNYTNVKRLKKVKLYTINIFVILIILSNSSAYIKAKAAHRQSDMENARHQ